MKKVLDQTVRELKREVNKKVLKVPEIEQKVLDATSNEPWGPHGSHMADIADATRNYYDHQMIMTILWKRINDTGRNWRHVYKSLTIMEYLVAHGSERVIDELKEHVYQLSTLTDFQYIDSSARDQGLNVRRKSQALVTLLNDKERIREVRQKAAANKDKYRGGNSTGGIFKSSSYYSTGGSYSGDRYDDDSYKYGGRDDDRYRDRDDDRHRDDDRYGRDWDRSGRGADRYGRDDDRYGRDLDRSVRDADRYGRDGDRYRDDYYDSEERYNSRRGDDRQSEKHGNFEKDRDRSFEDDDRHSSRSGGKSDDYDQDDRLSDRRPATSRMPAPPSYEEALVNPEPPNRSGEDQRAGNVGQVTNSEASVTVKVPHNMSSSNFDEFDPRASVAPPAGSGGDNLFGQGDSLNAVLTLPAPQGMLTATNTAGDFFGGSSVPSFQQPVIPSNTEPSQILESSVFGDSPFKADTPLSANTSALPPTGLSNAFSALPTNQSVPFEARDIFGNDSFVAAGGSNAVAVSSFPTTPFQAQEDVHNPNQVHFLQPWSSEPSMIHDSQVNVGQPVPLSTFPTNPMQQGPMAPQLLTTAPRLASQMSLPTPNVSPQMSAVTPSLTSQLSVPTQASTSTANIGLQPGVANSGGSSSMVKHQQDKFETKSTVWADSLSKGLIDLNIGGPKTNPLAGIGIDFDLLRTERKKEERASATKTSSTSMGKAMGSGSGLGMAGAGAVVPPAGPVMMNNMGMSPMMGGSMGVMPMGGNPGMVIRPGMGYPPAPAMGMGVNPMMGMGMGMGGYQNSQQQYSGYR